MPSSRASGTISTSRSRLHNDHSLCSAEIGCTASARRNVSAPASDKPEVAHLALRPRARPSRRRSPRSASSDRCGARSRGRWCRCRAAAATRRTLRARTSASPRMPSRVPSLGALDAELRRDRHLVAAALDRTADELLVRERPVHVGRVEERDAEVERPADGDERLVVVVVAVEVAHAHAAETLGGDGEAGAAERAGGGVRHVVLFR